MQAWRGKEKPRSTPGEEAHTHRQRRRGRTPPRQRHNARLRGEEPAGCGIEERRQCSVFSLPNTPFASVGCPVCSRSRLHRRKDTERGLRTPFPQRCAPGNPCCPVFGCLLQKNGSNFPRRHRILEVNTRLFFCRETKKTARTGAVSRPQAERDSGCLRPGFREDTVLDSSVEACERKTSGRLEPERNTSGKPGTSEKPGRKATTKQTAATYPKTLFSSLLSRSRVEFSRVGPPGERKAGPPRVYRGNFWKGKTRGESAKDDDTGSVSSGRETRQRRRKALWEKREKNGLDAALARKMSRAGRSALEKRGPPHCSRVPAV